MQVKMIAIRMNNADKLILLLIKLINCFFRGLENPLIGGFFVKGVENDNGTVRPGLYCKGKPMCFPDQTI